jgi:hypothetical protein
MVRQLETVQWSWPALVPGPTPPAMRPLDTLNIYLIYWYSAVVFKGARDT